MVGPFDLIDVDPDGAYSRVRERMRGPEAYVSRGKGQSVGETGFGHDELLAVDLDGRARK